MNPGKSPPQVDASKEVLALIKVLHDTGQRLEELTAGEVDAVADHKGRTFLLRRTQEELRDREAARQTAILNALPAHVALLDTQGVIILVNDAWRRFASTNALQGPNDGIGVNYLAVCDKATGEYSNEAHPVAEGIRSVLTGTTKIFTIEYSCHSPTEQRWFLMTVTPLDESRLQGVVVMHMNVTAERLAQLNLHTQELRFTALVENVADGICHTQANGVLLYVSPSMKEMSGYEADELVGHNLFEFMHPDDVALGIKSLTKIMRSPGTQVRTELRFRHKNGSWQTVESISKDLSHVPGIGGRVVNVRNVTERKKADAKIIYLNRVYAVLSGINSTIVRVSDREELFREVCRIAVETGGFAMALIGIVDPASKLIVPAASAGKDAELLASIKVLTSTRELASTTMVARAVREKQAVVSNDSQSDPQVLLGSRYADAGVRSMAIFPLIVSGESVGAFGLYAKDKDFFGGEEMKLLTEVSGDIAFAIDHLDKEERLNYIAYYDVLTGLANQTLFLERVAQYMRSAKAGGYKCAVFLIDLERFKNINDSLGRPSGDALLKQVALWLTHSAGDANLVARIGADHFALVLPQIRQEGSLIHLIEKTLKAFLDYPFRLNEAVLRMASKAGIVIFPEDGTNADTLFSNAEAALKKAKARGERYLFYTQAMTEAVAGKLTMENQLRHALEQGEFVLHYQPKVSLVSFKLTGAEALIRWNDPRTGLVPPDRFIPIMEETGMIHEVGQWALRKAVEDYLRWRAAGLAVVRIAVNISPLQLRNRSFVSEIEVMVGGDVHAADGLELEITESLIMEDAKHSVASLQAIRALGVTIAIDDFGTGFSSLSYLSRLPIDSLKIDRSFVTGMTTSPEGLALVSTIINLAHSLKFKVVAEGVETEEQSQLLRLLGCDEMQGYLFSEVVPREIFETKFLASHTSE